MVEKVIEILTPTPTPKLEALNIGNMLNNAVFGGVIDWYNHLFIHNIPSWVWITAEVIIVLMVAFWVWANFIR